MAKRVYIETYGCQMNVADSELMFGLLGREGYVRTEQPSRPNISSESATFIWQP